MRGEWTVIRDCVSCSIIFGNLHGFKSLVLAHGPESVLASCPFGIMCCTPGDPGGPGRPGCPVRPAGPCSPCCPGTPGIPGGPGGPGGP